MNTFHFEDLFVFEMANNHQGELEHGLRIIDEMARLAERHGVRAAVKLQLRELSTFVHPEHRTTSDNRHIPRFMSTAMPVESFRKLVAATKDRGLVTMATPFDEPSVDVLVELGIEIVKIGSPSARDWPLLEVVAECGLPVLYSTGGLTMKEIDDVASYFEHRMVRHALMHCVSIYPTATEDLQLDQIRQLQERFPDTTIGWSGHESPDDVMPVQLAVALGARIFERHVGVPTDEISLNAYSMAPAQVDVWLAAYRRAVDACGDRDTRRDPPPTERDSLHDLQRGVYAKRTVESGARLSRDDVYFAMPRVQDQLTSSDWVSGIVTRVALEPNEPALVAQLDLPTDPEQQIVYTAIHEVKAMLNQARLVMPTDFKLEISHHYGMENFREFGTVIIDCINREYCKKLLIQLPGQKNPLHYHRRKEETFQVLSGVLEVEIDGRPRTLHAGETLLVQPGVWHSFWTHDGAIFEEVSTTHYNDDSFYADKAINRMERSSRKTVVDHWGRHQILAD